MLIDHCLLLSHAEFRRDCGHLNRRRNGPDGISIAGPEPSSDGSRRLHGRAHDKGGLLGNGGANVKGHGGHGGGFAGGGLGNVFPLPPPFATASPNGDPTTSKPPPLPSSQPHPDGANTPNAFASSSTSSSFTQSLEAPTTMLPLLPVPTISSGDSTGGPMASNDVSSALPSETTNQADISHQSQQLSKGATAGIIITILFSIAVISLLFVRQRNKVRRREKMEAREQWWFGGEKSARPSGASSPRSRGTGSVSPEDRMKIQSMRSSFGTTFDNGLMPYDIDPSLPPIPEIACDSERNSYLTIPAPWRRDSDQSITAPMSVVPISPAESLAFPMPQVAPDGRSPDGELMATPPTLLNTKLTETRRDSEHSVKTPVLPNPFSDTTAKGGGASSDNFKPVVETIRRPFLRSREDELGVVPGDVVLVVKLFEDGWCLCEVVKGQAPASRGLVPIDCLREEGQTFAASSTAEGTGNLPNEETTRQLEGAPGTAADLVEGGETLAAPLTARELSVHSTEGAPETAAHSKVLSVNGNHLAGRDAHL